MSAPDPTKAGAMDAGSIEVREAAEADLPAIVALLADDELGAGRERPGERLAPAYLAAFTAIRAQGGNTLLVATDGAAIVGCLQLTIIPTLAVLGTTRAQIEGVRVARGRRGERIGETLIEDAVRRAREAGAGMMQLTTNASRIDAQRFYARLGFTGSHVGMKRTI